MAQVIREPGDGPGQSNTPHGIPADAQGMSMWQPRRSRIEVFDGDGKVFRQIKIDVR